MVKQQCLFGTLLSIKVPGRHFLLLGQGPVEQSSTNKPLAMRVVEDALAYSKKPPVI
jgi:hypothetical protein